MPENYEVKFILTNSHDTTDHTSFLERGGLEGFWHSSSLQIILLSLEYTQDDASLCVNSSSFLQAGDTTRLTSGTQAHGFEPLVSIVRLNKGLFAQ